MRPPRCLSNGITTLFGGGVGPTDGSNGTTITSGRWNIEQILQALEGIENTIKMEALKIAGIEKMPIYKAMEHILEHFDLGSGRWNLLPL